MEILLKKLGLSDVLVKIENPIFWWYFILFISPLLIIISIPLLILLEIKFLLFNISKMKNFILIFIFSSFGLGISLYLFSLLVPDIISYELMDKVVIGMLGLFIVINIKSYLNAKRALSKLEKKDEHK